jgi:GNAT superfamily N-acetyltransferase
MLMRLQKNMMLGNILIRWADPDEYARVLQHYEVCNYGGGIDGKDQVAIAVSDEIVGAVRICSEIGVIVLRGMQMKAEFQRKGIGSDLLGFLEANTNMNGCYCLPYKHLVNFYAKIGFEEISQKGAPVFLAARLEKYQSNGNTEIIIMQIKK